MEGISYDVNSKEDDRRGKIIHYTEYADRMSPYEYAEKVIKGELKDLVLTFELDIGV